MVLARLAWDLHYGFFCLGLGWVGPSWGVLDPAAKGSLGKDSAGLCCTGARSAWLRGDGVGWIGLGWTTQGYWVRLSKGQLGLAVLSWNALCSPGLDWALLSSAGGRLDLARLKKYFSKSCTEYTSYCL